MVRSQNVIARSTRPQQMAQHIRSNGTGTWLERSSQYSPKPSTSPSSISLNGSGHGMRASGSAYSASASSDVALESEAVCSRTSRTKGIVLNWKSLLSRTSDTWAP